MWKGILSHIRPTTLVTRLCSLALVALLLAACDLGGSDAALAPPGQPPGGAAPREGVARIVPEPIAWPVRARGRQLVDARGTPVLLHGTAPWSAIVNLTRDEMDRYLEDRARKGFNALYVNLIEYTFSNQTPSWRNVNGDDPFVGTVDGYVPDMTDPNEPYWEHADYFVRRAGELGIVVIAFPAYSGWQQGFDGWSDAMRVNGPGRLRTYGRFLGARYRDSPHVIWSAGGDWGPNGPLWDLTEHVAQWVEGIRETDRDQVWTGHGGQESGIEVYGYLGLDLNTTYRYPVAEVPDAVYLDYQRTPTTPFVFFEGRYENESEGTALNMRRQAYAALLGGAFGQFYGNAPLWFMGEGWEAALDDPGAMSMVHVGDLARSRSLHTLVPDYDAQTVTGDRGDRRTGGWVPAARAEDGSTVVAYVPDGRSVTVDMGRVAGPLAQAWCYSPVTGGAADLGRFPTAGERVFEACAAPDWVLVLDAVAE